MSFELILPFLRPIESLLLDENVSEIMGNPDASWWYERDGIMFQEQNISFDAGKLQTGLEVIANQLGKKLDEDNPLLHAQLPDGSRLAAVIPPVVRCTPALIIRKFTSRHYTVDDLIARGTLTRALADFLAQQIRSGNPHDHGVHVGERVLALVGERGQREADGGQNENRHLEIGIHYQRIAILFQKTFRGTSNGRSGRCFGAHCFCGRDFCTHCWPHFLSLPARLHCRPDCHHRQAQTSTMSTSTAGE